MRSYGWCYGTESARPLSRYNQRFTAAFRF
jgi:hypothetical protein